MERNVRHGFKVEANLVNNDTSTTTNISDYITNVMVRKRYFVDTFSLFVVDMMITAELRNEIRDNNCMIDLTISYYSIADSENKDVDSSEKIPEGIVFQGLLRIYDKPFTTTLSKKDEESSSDDTQSNSIPAVPYRIAGVPDKTLKINEDIVGEIYKSATLSDVLVNILSRTGIYDIRIQQPDNTELYSNIIVPPLSLVPALSFIDNHYHVYSTGLNVFVDDNPAIYCYPPVNVTQTTNMLECTVLSPDVSAESQQINTLSVDDDNNMYIKYATLPPFAHPKEIIQHSVGTDVIFYSYDDLYNLNKRDQNLESSYKKVRYIWNPEKIKTSEVNIKEIERQSAAISLVFSAVNPDLFNPLTLVRLISQDYPSASGDYIISEMSYALSSSDHKYFNGNVSISCIKK